MVNVFNVSAFFIVLREVLEACLVVGIVLAYLSKSGATHLKKYVWLGTGLSIAISVVLGIVFGVLFYSRGNKLFSGKAEAIFEGIAFLVAAVLLSWMILWMMFMGKNIKKQMEDQIDKAIEGSSGGRLGIFGIVFIQVLREGIETVIFLLGAAGAVDETDAWKGILLPGFLAILVGVVASYLVFRGMITLDIQSFFLVSSVILMAFAAGLVSHGLHELQEADWFGPYDGVDPIDRDWWNATMWSTKPCCNDKTNEFFAMLRALLGYQDTPTFIEVVSYFGYWLVILVILAAFNWGAVRAARNTTSKTARGLSIFLLCATFIGCIYSFANPTWTGLLTMIVGFVLSAVAIVGLFDVFSRHLAAVRKARAKFLPAVAVVFALYSLFVLCLHIAKLACLEASCTLPNFFWYGLIFNEDWLLREYNGTSYPAVSALTVSFILTLYVSGVFVAALFLFTTHIDTEGNYIYDDAKPLARTDTPEQLGLPAEAGEQVMAA